MAKLSEGFLKLNSGYLFPEVARRVKVWLEKNKDAKVIRLGVGNTTEPITPYIANAMKKKIELLEDVKTYTGYGDEQGDEPLRAALRDFYEKEYSVKLEKTDFFISDGAKSDAANIQSIFSKDCIIAVQDPSYPVYVDSNVASDRSGKYNTKTDSYDKFVYMPCNEKNNFIPEPPKEHVDLIYLCFPNNPTGTVATKEQLKKFVDYAIKEKAVIIYDAAYCDYIRDKNIPHTIYEIEGAEKCSIEINSFSKNAGFTGVRLGWSIVPKTITSTDQSADCTYNFWNRRQCTFFNGASNIAQAGGIAALSETGRKECKSLVDYYLENVKIIKEGLESVGMVCYGGVNSPYVWVKIPNGYTSWEFFDFLLDKAHVVVTPGSGFGKSGEGFVRISAYGHKENIIEGIELIKKVIKEVK